MGKTDLLNQYVVTLPADWKWQFSAVIPAELQDEWQGWLAASQREEDQALMRFWNGRARRAA